MSLVALPGSKVARIGPSVWVTNSTPTLTQILMDAANEALIVVGRIETSDGGSHTLNTGGSSSIFWRTGSVTFANAGTTVKVGFATHDAANGPPGRATNVADVITFDVSKSLTGGGGGITGSASQNHVPDTGTKTIANGDLVAFAIQMTARGGSDVVNATVLSNGNVLQHPAVTSFIGGAYAAVNAIPNVFITFNDGATGWFATSEIFTTQNVRTWNSGSGTVEYGQLYQLPFPYKVYGLYGWLAASADLDIILYSDPLGGSPVAEKTVAFDSNTVGTASGRRFEAWFPSPYQVAANQPIGAIFKPGGSNISAYYKTLGAAGQRASDPWGTSGYGISRASGAFADANSGLDHYYIGLIAGAFDDGAGSGGGPVGQQCM